MRARNRQGVVGVKGKLKMSYCLSAALTDGAFLCVRVESRYGGVGWCGDGGGVV